MEIKNSDHEDWDDVHWFACCGNIDDSTDKFSKSGFFTALTDYNQTALHIAVKYDNPEMAAFIYEQCPQLATQVDNESRTILHYACASHQHDTKLLAQVLSYCDDETIAKVDDAGNTALQLAVEYSHDDFVALLLSSKPQLLRIVNPITGHSILHGCAKNAYRFVPAILKADPSLTQMRTKGTAKTLLHTAIKFAPMSIISLLISVDATMLHKKDANGFTPFLQCVQRNATKQMNYLLDMYPAVIDHRNTFEKNALHLTWSAKFARKLIQLKPELAYQVSNMGCTPLQTTFNLEGYFRQKAENDNENDITLRDWFKKCAILLRQQPDWMDLENGTISALHLATHCQDDDLIKFVFLHCPEHVNLRDAKWSTPTPFEQALIQHNEFALHLFYPHIDIMQAFSTKEQCLRLFLLDLNPFIDQQFTQPLTHHLLPSLLRIIHEYLDLPPNTNNNNKKRKHLNDVKNKLRCSKTIRFLQ